MTSDLSKADASKASGAVLSIEVTKTMTIGDLSKRIDAQVGPFLRAYHLSHQGEPLSHKWTVDECDIVEGDVIALAIK